jgi:hypothetical protein
MFSLMTIVVVTFSHGSALRSMRHPTVKHQIIGHASMTTGDVCKSGPSHHQPVAVQVADRESSGVGVVGEEPVVKVHTVELGKVPRPSILDGPVVPVADQDVIILPEPHAAKTTQGLSPSRHHDRVKADPRLGLTPSWSQS